MALIQRVLKFVRRNVDPSTWPEAVDHSAADYIPTGGGMFRALNASVAGKITIRRPDNTSVQVYVNTGWNPQAGWKVLTGAAGDGATIIAAEIEKGA